MTHTEARTGCVGHDRHYQTWCASCRAANAKWTVPARDGRPVESDHGHGWPSVVLSDCIRCQRGEPVR